MWPSHNILALHIVQNRQLAHYKQADNNKSFFKMAEKLMRPTKGQLISECLFGVLNFPKNQRKKLMDFCPKI